jgi:hypothetical protein
VADGVPCCGAGGLVRGPLLLDGLCSLGEFATQAAELAYFRSFHLQVLKSNSPPPNWLKMMDWATNSSGSMAKAIS